VTSYTQVLAKADAERDFGQLWPVGGSNPIPLIVALIALSVSDLPSFASGQALPRRSASISP
jgi:hypothetical protein